MQKGQAILEFIFLILIVVVYLVSVTMPLVNDTQNIILDTENITRANNECQKITNAIKEIDLFEEGSRQTLSVYIPSNTSIDCNSSKGISFETQLTQKPYPSTCDKGICTKTFTTTSQLQCAVGKIKGPQKVGITIQKLNGYIDFLRSE